MLYASQLDPGDGDGVHLDWRHRVVLPRGDLADGDAHVHALNDLAEDRVLRLTR